MSTTLDAITEIIEDPYIAYLGDGLVMGTSPDPDDKHLLVIEVSTFNLKKYGTFQYYEVKKEGATAKTLWEGGMMNHMVSNVFLVMDEPKGTFIGIFYNAMNDSECLQFLGKLDENCDLYRAAIEKFKNGPVV